jgi:hypothetical protein
VNKGNNKKAISIWLYGEYEDTKGIIRIRKFEGRKTQKGKGTNNDLQNTTQKTKDQVIRTLIKVGVNSSSPEGLAIPAPLVTPVVLLLNDTNVI